MFETRNIESIQRDIQGLFTVIDELDVETDKVEINDLLEDIWFGLSLLDSNDIRDQLDSESFIELEHYVDMTMLHMLELEDKLCGAGPK